MKRFYMALMVLVFFVFTITAQTRGGELEIVDAGGTVVGRFGEAHALVIGESEYTNGWGRLPGVKEDVAAVGQLFKELGFNVVTLENVNRHYLRNGIEDFLHEYGYSEDSRLIIYFAGHGATLDLGRNRKMGYIVPVDAPLPEARDFSNRAIPMSQFETWAKNTKARHILFIFDSCFSGTVFSTTRSAVSPAIDRLINQPVRQFITSGDANEKVPDTSIFRRQLEYALRDGLADPYKTGYVSGTALGMFLYETVANYSNGKQHPQFGKLNDVDLDKGDFVFVVGGKRPASGTSTPPPTPQLSAQEHYDRGEALRKQEIWDSAIAEYSTAIRLNPRYANAYFRRGTAYNNKRDYDRAIVDFTEAIRLNPNYSGTYNNRGLAYFNKNDYDRAIVDFTEAIRINPNYALAYYNRGIAYNNKRDYDRAIVDFTEAIRLNPDFAMAYNNRGFAYFNKNDYDRAIADYEAALRIDPTHTRAKNNLEIARKARGR